MKKLISVLIFVVLMIVPFAYAEGVQELTLYAGQNIEVGTVSVWNTGDELHVKYEITTGDWIITETHLYIGKNVPPVSTPGQLPYCVPDDETNTEVEYVIALDEIYGYTLATNKKGKSTGKMIQDEGINPGVKGGDEISIAAYAEMISKKSEGAWADGTNFGKNWAMYSNYAIQTPGPYFQDDFDDNTLDTTKWTEDIESNSSDFSNAYDEINQEARFSIFCNGHAYLLSKVITIADWNTITVQGKWKFSVTPVTPEMACYIYDADTDEVYGMIHKSYFGTIKYYYSKTDYLEESMAIPEAYVPFKIVITKTNVEFWEDGSKIKEFSTTALASTTHFKLKIGSMEGTGWENRYSYFDDIQITAN